MPVSQFVTILPGTAYVPTMPLGEFLAFIRDIPGCQIAA
jgi:hypothetical protein